MAAEPEFLIRFCKANSNVTDASSIFGILTELTEVLRDGVVDALCDAFVRREEGSADDRKQHLIKVIDVRKQAHKWKIGSLIQLAEGIMAGDETAKKTALPFLRNGTDFWCKAISGKGTGKTGPRKKADPEESVRSTAMLVSFLGDVDRVKLLL